MTVTVRVGSGLGLGFMGMGHDPTGHWLGSGYGIQGFRVRVSSLLTAAGTLDVAVTVMHMKGSCMQ